MFRGYVSCDMPQSRSSQVSTVSGVVSDTCRLCVCPQDRPAEGCERGADRHSPGRQDHRVRPDHRDHRDHRVLRELQVGGAGSTSEHSGVQPQMA